MDLGVLGGQKHDMKLMLIGLFMEDNNITMALFYSSVPGSVTVSQGSQNHQMSAASCQLDV